MDKMPIIKHPVHARFLLPLYYDYIKNELPKICEESGANYEEESKKAIESAMVIGDQFWDQMERGLNLLRERFGPQD
jgi:hypothetical protein